MRFAAVLTALSILCASPAAQAGDLSGIVYDGSGVPAANVQLSVPELGAQAVTAADGTYRLEGLAAGDHEIAIGLGGDNVQYTSATVAEQGEAQRNIVLFSRASVQRAANADAGVNSVEAEAAFADALELSEQMLDGGIAARDGRTWRWNDLDG